LYVWLRVPEGIDTGPNGTLIAHAMEEGMLYVPGEYCYPLEGQPRRSDYIRLSFGVQTCENIERGIAALARALVRSGARKRPLQTAR
jgi:2-aminoadipate transaminase